jgi:hypothetical protein
MMSRKTPATEHGPVRIETPRDCKGSFEPQIVEGAAVLRGLRRQDPRAVFARLVDARDRSPSGRDPRGSRSVAT